MERDMQNASACALEYAISNQGTELMFGGKLEVSENFEFMWSNLKLRYFVHSVFFIIPIASNFNNFERKIFSYKKIGWVLEGVEWISIWALAG